MAPRFVSAILMLFLCASGSGYAQSVQSADDDAVFLVAHPAFRDAGYRQAVLVAAPVPSGGHVGVIINRPTSRSLISFFPQHEPAKKVSEPVHYGGPFSPGALVALVKADASLGAGTLPLMKNLHIAFRAATIDKVIEETPNEARYYVGYVGWRPRELKSEIDRGLWSVVSADLETIFQKDMSGLWKDMVAQSRRLRADRDRSSVQAFANDMAPFFQSTLIVSDGAKRPSRIDFASGFSIAD